MDQDIACVPAVSRCGLPLGYQVFAGNRNDVTTLEEIVETMERRYGCADCPERRQAVDPRWIDLSRDR